MLGLCVAVVPYSGMCDWDFALTSLLPNLILIRSSWAFWKTMGGGSSPLLELLGIVKAARFAPGGAAAEKAARLLFFHSLWYLPVILGLMMFHKSGVVWSEIFEAKEKQP